MSFVALVVSDLNIDISLLKKIHNLSNKSLVEIKKSIRDVKPLVIANMLKSTERDEIKLLLAVIDLCKKENISFQLFKNNEPIKHDNENLKGDLITPEEFSKLVERAKLIELQTQELVDSETIEDTQ